MLSSTPQKDGTRLVKVDFATKEEAERHEQFVLAKWPDTISSEIMQSGKRWLCIHLQPNRL